jgi:hypothetical protein
MPGLSGPTLCEQIRAADVRTPAYVVKPDVPGLVETVRRLLAELSA